MAASVSMVLPAAIVAPMTAWLAVQTVVGLPGSQTNGRRPGADHLRFVVFVPAHDEASGIAATLVSLCAMEYPADAFAVHVVADNCTDATATVAREFEVEVHERDEPGNPGKGPALNWLFDRLSARGDVFDAVVVIDADTLVVADFLTAMDGALQQGADVAQGHYTVRDPAASTATSLRYAALACRHHLRARARTRLGASCGLYGNGMVFRRELLADRRWSGHLVEDAEFQIDLLLDGHRVVYVPEAVAEAEMPLSLEQAATQNQRWERGRVELAKRAVPQLLRRFVAGGTPRVATGDALLDQLTPPISVLATVHTPGLLVGLGGLVVRGSGSRPVVAVHLLGVGVLVGHVLAGLRSVGADRQHYVALLSAPRAIVWKLGIWGSALVPGRAVSWDRTARNADLVGAEP